MMSVAVKLNQQLLRIRTAGQLANSSLNHGLDFFALNIGWRRYSMFVFPIPAIEKEVRLPSWK